MTPGDDLTGGSDGTTPVHADDLIGLRHGWVSTQGALDELERRNIVAGRKWATKRRRRLADIDDAFARELHRRCFGEVWSWAGEYRSRATSIGIAATQTAPALRNLCDDAHIWFGPTDPSMDGDEALARFHHRFVEIHPFANGNGRTGRILTDVLARSAGLVEPSWGTRQTGPRNTYLVALRAADAGDITPLATFLRG